MEDHHQVPPPRERPNLRQNQNYQPPPTPVKPMSKPTDSSSYRPDEPNRRALCTCITTVVLLVGLLIFVLWLIYRPSKPHFAVVSAAVYGLNATTPPLMSTSMQFTIVIQNPNRRVAIYFDTLNAYVSYRSHPITTPVAFPALYMEEHSSVSLSPMIGGSPVPVSPDVSNGLAMDEAYGVVGVSVIMQGRLRWKTGAIRTGHYGIYVKCDVMMSLKKGVTGQVPLTGAPACYVDI
ncbi:NDR1/HIN1-like protein 12 [Prosopis cineraria]|uniref:NDR1/HIN1-like protein 12 n=1 Tax=Prosopis cineraria TaxID=364024 RepID=UPI00240F8AE9|nr:NDR1/HIN1-like protein 12 [Prosopis cineraria]